MGLGQGVVDNGIFVIPLHAMVFDLVVMLHVGYCLELYNKNTFANVVGGFT